MPDVALGKVVAHRESHDQLLVQVPRWGRRVLGAVDAVVVPAARPVTNLATAARLAARLDAHLIVLCSGAASAEEFADLAPQVVGLRWLATDVPGDYAHPLFEFATSEVVDAVDSWTGDLSTKRNIALVLARLLGWRTMLMLDDDIRCVASGDVRSAAGALRSLSAVGLSISEFPDNSVVCHANRLAGGSQGVFVSGSSLLVSLGSMCSFFPDVYNEDWLFLHDEVAQSSVGICGTATQLPYDPFDDPRRAASQEFGDVLAEGLFELLHQRRPVEVATTVPWWRFFLDRRAAFAQGIADGMSRVTPAAGAVRALPALRAASARRAAIAPEMLADFVHRWRSDLRRWARRLDGLDVVKSTAAPAALGLESITARRWRRRQHVTVSRRLNGRVR